MSKSKKFVTSFILGAAGAAAATAFFASKTGRLVKEKITDIVDDYKESHEDINANLVSQAKDLKAQAIDKYTEVKGKFENGEIHYEDVLNAVKGKSEQAFNAVKDSFDKSEKAAESTVTSEDITVYLPLLTADVQELEAVDEAKTPENDEV